MNNPWVVIPTYNEKDNIEKLGLSKVVAIIENVNSSNVSEREIRQTVSCRGAGGNGNGNGGNGQPTDEESFWDKNKHWLIPVIAIAAAIILIIIIVVIVMSVRSKPKPKTGLTPEEQLLSQV